MSSVLVAVLPGDGIGEEVVEQAVRVLERAAALGELELEVRAGDIGGAALDSAGVPLPPPTLELCDEADAILLGAVGGPQWADLPPARRPEQGLLSLRKELGLFVNLRPVRARAPLAPASPLKPRLLDGVDLVIVRELTGGIYFGPRERRADTAIDTCVYTRAEVERVARFAAETARSRGRRLTSVDKANVLETSRLWRETVSETVASDYPDLELEHQLVDAMAMHLLRRPADFDVIVTENMFGDILSDEASMLAGSLGMLPSASLGAPGDAGTEEPTGRRGLYEPVHGSAPDIAGRGVANPYGAIECVALLLRHSLGRADLADAVGAAVDAALEDGALTTDLLPGDRGDPGHRGASTIEVGDAVLERLGGL